MQEFCRKDDMKRKIRGMGSSVVFQGNHLDARKAFERKKASFCPRTIILSIVMEKSKIVVVSTSYS